MKKKTKWVTINDLVIEKSQSLLFIFGIFVFILVAIDYISYLIPFQLTNPTWQFEFIGKVANITWAPLLAFVCVFFYQSKQPISLRKLYLLRFLSWFALIVGLFHLLLLPLTIQNAYRIHRNNQAQINTQIQQRTEQLKRFQTRLESVSDQELTDFIANLNRQNQIPNIDNPQEFKEQVLGRVQQSEQQIRSQAEIVRKNQKNQLAKNAISWCLILVISGFAFIWIWYLSSWTRTMKFTETEESVELETEVWQD